MSILYSIHAAVWDSRSVSSTMERQYHVCTIVNLHRVCSGFAYRFRYSITRMSAKPVISNTSITSSQTLITFMEPIFCIFF